MTPRPPYKWKSFWFGLLVLGFLGFVWVRSMDRLDTVGFDMGRARWKFSSTMGKFVAEGFDGLSIAGSIRNIHISSEPRGGSDRGLPAAYEHLTFERFPSFHARMLAHWFLILLFLVPWASVLAWRWHRMKRLTKTNA